MRRRRKNALIPLIFMILVLLLIYGFVILRGEWLSLVMGFFFMIGISKFLDDYIGKRYFLYTFSILISIFIFTLLYVNTVRNNSSEKITVEGEISAVHNSYRYVQFELKEYPDISFKSYDSEIRASFREYTPDSYYKKTPVNLDKKVSITVFKSHLDWYRKPYVAFLNKLRFPLEVEIESFVLVE
ncbi:hypothetical protein [Emticicia agri]|uniref:DUF4131 domain-containing protein n=1 Tax=Emticicia agri TaxID=2492393 RepID=A0A4Q5M3S7_9BACT|nr:hypothetical protein [Emticicia agri]RYU97066.1 hypothetical protein EWM59_03925 [Emticicia agri]